jgi:hypothetical protein
VPEPDRAVALGFHRPALRERLELAPHLSAQTPTTTTTTKTSIKQYTLSKQGDRGERERKKAN